MIYVENTPNNAGVTIYGDYIDFENLYEALHTVVGDNEGEFIEYDSARLRVLSLCYEIRHAMMGHREVEFVDNGINEEKQKHLSVVAPYKNVYLKINELWPEIIFVTIALNKFVELYAQKQAKSKYSMDLFTNKKVIWDESIAHVRLLQAKVAACLKRTVSQAAYARMMSAMNGKAVFIAYYATQYLDLLNYRFINMDREKRLKHISIMAKRIVERGQEYRDLESDLFAEAKKRNCHVNDLRLNLDFPDEIDW